MRCSIHRVLLACLIVAAKYINDTAPQNQRWAHYSRIRGFQHFGFSVRNVNMMERQLLSLLDWDLRIRPDDLYPLLEPFLAPIRIYLHQANETQRRHQRERQLLINV